MDKNEKGLLKLSWASFLVLLMTWPLLFPINVKAQIAKGADIGWLSYFENSKGIEYLNDSSQVQDAMEILQDHDLNAIRLRAFVNPTLENIGEVNTEGVVKNALRAHQLGMDVMITIHYSDVWADPGNQYQPVAWQNLPFNELLQTVYDYTYDLMDALLNAGVTPKWVQVGNETNPGFLWPDGEVRQSNGFANMPNFVALSNRGYEAIKERSPSTKVITQLAGGDYTAFFQQFFDEFYAQGGKNDIIGLSYYPRWNKGSIQQVSNNMNNLVDHFNKDVMICEIGNWETEQATTYNLLVDAIEAINAVPNGRGLGVFYWEPIAAKSINGYEQGLAVQINDHQYQFSWVLDAFTDGALNCSPTSVTPWQQVDGAAWEQSSDVTGYLGGSVKFGPHPVEGGTWSWRGPQGFSADTREIELTDLQRDQAGMYTATYIPSDGCPVSLSFPLSVYEVGEIIIENPGFETGVLAPWIGTGRTGVDIDLKNSGTYSAWLGGGHSELTQSVKGLLPNTTYELSGYIRNWSGDNGVVTLGVRSSGRLAASTEVGMTGNNGDDFVRATLNFTTGSSDTTAVIYASTSKAKTWGKLDDVRLLSLGVSVSSTDIKTYEKSEQFTIYPNPVSKNILIHSNTNIGEVDVVIYSMQGQQVIRKEINALQASSVNISVAQLPKGTYFIKFISNLGFITTQKLLIK